MTFSTTQFGFFLILEPGEELVRSLICFAREQEVDAAVLTGVGTVSELELGAGGSREREHRRCRLTEPVEVCSLTGTLTLVDGEPFPHMHGTFARSDHSVLGGHVYEAVCGTAVEVALQLVPELPGRTADSRSNSVLTTRTAR